MPLNLSCAFYQAISPMPRCFSRRRNTLVLPRMGPKSSRTLTTLFSTNPWDVTMSPLVAVQLLHALSDDPTPPFHPLSAHSPSSLSARQDQDERQVPGGVHGPPAPGAGEGVSLQPLHHHPPQSRAGRCPRAHRTAGQCCGAPAKPCPGWRWGWGGEGLQPKQAVVVPPCSTSLSSLPNSGMLPLPQGDLEGHHAWLHSSPSLHHHLCLSAGENLVSESEGKREEGEQKEDAAAKPAHQHHHTNPTRCRHTGTHRRPLQQQRPKPHFLVSANDQGGIHALTPFTSYRHQEISTMQQSPAGPRALKSGSPFPKTRWSPAEPTGWPARLGEVAPEPSQGAGRLSPM